MTISSDIIEASVSRPYLFIMTISYIEICRRGIWNIFRVEKEHIINCEKFNAVINYDDLERKVIHSYSQLKPGPQTDQIIH